MIVSDLQRIINNIPSNLWKRTDIVKGYVDLYSQKTHKSKQVDFCSDVNEFEAKVKEAILDITPRLYLYRDAREILKSLYNLFTNEKMYFDITKYADNYYIEIYKVGSGKLILKYLLNEAEVKSLNEIFDIVTHPSLKTLIEVINSQY